MTKENVALCVGYFMNKIMKSNPQAGETLNVLPLHATISMECLGSGNKCTVKITAKHTACVTLRLNPNDVSTPAKWMNFLNQLKESDRKFITELAPRNDFDTSILAATYGLEHPFALLQNSSEWDELYCKFCIAKSLSHYIFDVVTKSFTESGYRKDKNHDVWLTPSAKIRIIRHKNHNKELEITKYRREKGCENDDKRIVSFDMRDLPMTQWESQLFDEINAILGEAHLISNFINSFVVTISFVDANRWLGHLTETVESVVNEGYNRMRKYWNTDVPKWLVDVQLVNTYGASAVGIVSPETKNVYMISATKKCAPNFYTQKDRMEVSKYAIEIAENGVQ